MFIFFANFLAQTDKAQTFARSRKADRSVIRYVANSPPFLNRLIDNAILSSVKFFKLVITRRLSPNHDYLLAKRCSETLCNDFRRVITKLKVCALKHLLQDAYS